MEYGSCVIGRGFQDRIEKTGKTPKAIVTVALYGMPYKVDEIMVVADRYGIPIIEDAAEGFGSRYDGRMLVRLENMGCCRSMGIR